MSVHGQTQVLHHVAVRVGPPLCHSHIRVHPGDGLVTKILPLEDTYLRSLPVRCKRMRGCAGAAHPAAQSTRS